MPKVSLIVPVHNAGEYLIPMLDSIVNQTFKDIEIILIDDGSTDGSRETLKQYEAADNRIKVIFREKTQDELFGQKYSADLGRSIATGEYIMLLDHDDKLVPNAVEVLYSYTNNGTIDVIQGRYTQIDESGNVILKTPDFWQKPTIISNLDSLSEDILLLHLAYAPIAVWACLIRNEFQKDIELPDCIYNDTNFIWELKIRARTFCYIPDEVYIYNIYGDSTSGSSNSNKTISHIFLVFNYLNEFLKQSNISEKLWKLYYVFKFFTLNKMYAGISPQTRLNYFHKVSKEIENDMDITHLLMMYPMNSDVLIHYLLLRQYRGE